MPKAFLADGKGGAGAALLMLLAMQGCLTYSSYQSASIVERGEMHATLGVSRSSFLEEESDRIAWWNVDGEFRTIEPACVLFLQCLFNGRLQDCIDVIELVLAAGAHVDFRP